MKEVKHYICEICGTEYNIKTKCQQCEKSHTVPKEIVKARYRGYNCNQKGYPYAITIKMADGENIVYKR